jgi:large subunit ribosomal protein L23
MRPVLKRPLLSEKSMSMNDQGQYVFEVRTDANKIEIRKAIEERYKVGVSSVRTVTIHPKGKMRMTRRGFITGKTPARKKAIITLREGQRIDVVGDLPND